MSMLVVMQLVLAAPTSENVAADINVLWFDWQITVTTVTLQKQAVDVQPRGGSLPLKSKAWTCRYAFAQHRADPEDPWSDGEKIIIITCQKSRGEEILFSAHCSPAEPAFRGPVMVLTERPSGENQRERKRHGIFVSCQEHQKKPKGPVRAP